MKCDRYEQLIHLNREGERSRVEEENLRRHLDTCASCRRELHRTEKIGVSYRKFRELAPELPDPNRIARRIRERIAEEERYHNRNPIVEAFDFLARVSLVPSYRYVAALFLFVVLGLFFVESASLVIDVRRLEERMGKFGAEQVVIDAKYSLALEKASRFVDENQLAMLRSQFDIRMENGRLAMGKLGFTTLYHSLERSFSRKFISADFNQIDLQRLHAAAAQLKPYAVVSITPRPER